jgi:hypothetical protein
LVVRRSGTVLAWSMPDAAELGRQPGPGPVLGMQHIPGGVITWSGDLFAWWGAGRRRPRITRRMSTLPHPSEYALASRQFGVTWTGPPKAAVNIWRLDGDLLWQGRIGGLRGIHPLLEPHLMAAPHVWDSHYTLGTVDYAADRFVLAHNSQTGILLVDQDGQAKLHLTNEPHGRNQMVNALLPASPYYVEASRHGIQVWDLDTDERVAVARLPANTADVEIDPRGQAAWTIDTGGQVRRFDLPALTETFRTCLPLIGHKPALLSADAYDRIAVTDEQPYFYVIDAARSVPSGPVGLNSPAVDSVFTPDGRRVLVAQRNGDVLILDLPD